MAWLAVHGRLREQLVADASAGQPVYTQSASHAIKWQTMDEAWRWLHRHVDDVEQLALMRHGPEPGGSNHAGKAGHYGPRTP